MRFFDVYIDPLDVLGLILFLAIFLPITLLVATFAYATARNRVAASLVAFSLPSAILIALLRLSDFRQEDHLFVLVASGCTFAAAILCGVVRWVVDYKRRRSLPDSEVEESEMLQPAESRWKPTLLRGFAPLAWLALVAGGL